jgi:N-acetylglucosamine-6-phosphate deacetylase
MLITNGKIITPKGIITGFSLQERGGKITAIAPADKLQAASGEETVDAGGCFVAPGFIDIHVHGAVGCDTMDGSVETIGKIARYHATGGTTAMVPTTVTANAEAIMKVIDAVANAQGHDFGGSEILGVHIEGPYISAAKRGAQDPEQIRLPNPKEYQQWLERNDIITHVTLAPELEGAFEFIEKLAEHEILASGGHTEATEEIAAQAIERGLSHATHLFNCMSSMTKSGAFRSAGFAEAVLADDRVTIELIADGKHLPAAVMKMAIKAKGVDGVCLVTDATAGAGLPEGSEFQIGNVKAVVADGVAMSSDKSSLAGSTAQTITLVRNIANLGVSLVDAVRMASLSPARVLGISGRKGSLEERKDADIVFFDETFRVRRTIIGGRTVFAGE